MILFVRIFNLFQYESQKNDMFGVCFDYVKACTLSILKQILM